MRALERGEQYVLHERRFPRAGNTRHADETAERNLDVDLLEVVLGGAFDHESRCRRVGCTAAGDGLGRVAPTRQILRRQRIGAVDELRGRPFEHDAAAVLTRTRPEV